MGSIVYTLKGTTISFKCREEDYLAGDAAKIFYTCQKPSVTNPNSGQSDSGTTNSTDSNSTDTTLAPVVTEATVSLNGYTLVPNGHEAVPKCRAPEICKSLDLIDPPEESGLSKPLQACIHNLFHLVRNGYMATYVVCV